MRISPCFLAPWLGYMLLYLLLLSFHCPLYRQVVKNYAKVKVWFSSDVNVILDFVYIYIYIYMHIFCSSRVTALKHRNICLDNMYKQAGTTVCFRTCLCHSTLVLQALQNREADYVLQYPKTLFWDLVLSVIFFYVKSRYFHRILAFMFPKERFQKSLQRKIWKMWCKLGQRFRRKTPKIIKGTLLSL